VRFSPARCVLGSQCIIINLSFSVTVCLLTLLLTNLLMNIYEAVREAMIRCYWFNTAASRRYERISYTHVYNNCELDCIRSTSRPSLSQYVLDPPHCCTRHTRRLFYAYDILFIIHHRRNFVWIKHDWLTDWLSPQNGPLAPFKMDNSRDSFRLFIYIIYDLFFVILLFLCKEKHGSDRQTDRRTDECNA